MLAAQPLCPSVGRARSFVLGFVASCVLLCVVCLSPSSLATVRPGLPDQQRPYRAVALPAHFNRFSGGLQPSFTTVLPPCGYLQARTRTTMQALTACCTDVFARQCSVPEAHLSPCTLSVGMLSALPSCYALCSGSAGGCRGCSGCCRPLLLSGTASAEGGRLPACCALTTSVQLPEVPHTLGAVHPSPDSVT